jgi:hypothetical protein
VHSIPARPPPPRSCCGSEARAAGTLRRRCDDHLGPLRFFNPHSVGEQALYEFVKLAAVIALIAKLEAFMPFHGLDEAVFRQELGVHASGIDVGFSLLQRDYVLEQFDDRLACRQGEGHHVVAEVVAVGWQHA